MAFTRYSRMRLLRIIAKLDWPKMEQGVFITLTYPDVYATCTSGDRTRHRSWFHRSIENSLKVKVPIIWRTEWQERRTGQYAGYLLPHHHMMVFTNKFVPYKDVNNWWKSIIGTTEYVRTQVKRLHGAEGAGRYLAAYMSKVPSLVNGAYLNSRESSGRQWGIMRKDLLAWRDVEWDDELSESMYNICVEVQAELDGRNGHRQTGSFSVLGEIRKDQFIAALQKKIDMMERG